jgi:uncharacterized protein YecE (DUF72 family)
MTGRVYIGTSGWNYDAWRDAFYGGQRKTNWLACCGRRFTAIEINATFYRLQTVDTFRRWRRETPPAFRFALKANRYVTHNKKLGDPLPAIRLERDRAGGLGDKLVAVVWQLPRTLHKNLDRLEQFARALRAWRRVRHAIEFRHESWFEEEVADCLRRHGIAVCQSDAADWPLWPAVTADLVYVRLHGRPVTYASRYSDGELAAWASRVQGWQRQGCDVHVYFDNDVRRHAPFNALRLIELVGRPAAVREDQMVAVPVTEAGKSRPTRRRPARAHLPAGTRER